MTGIFVWNSILLGIGLAMDAFSVSVAQGLADPEMRQKKAVVLAGAFGFFQFLMPMTGWVLVHAAAQKFMLFERFVPWIALFLLTAIGINMIRESLAERKSGEQTQAAGLSAGWGEFFIKVLLLQGIATSIDALSVGFAIASYDFRAAAEASVIIALVTFGICRAGTEIGKRAGRKLTAYASLLGGVILIGIGVEIFLRNISHSIPGLF